MWTRSVRSKSSLDRIAPNPNSRARLSAKRSSKNSARRSATRACFRPILVRTDPVGAKRSRSSPANAAGAPRAARPDRQFPPSSARSTNAKCSRSRIVENVQRADLNPIEEAEAYKALIDRFGRTQEAVATGRQEPPHMPTPCACCRLPDDLREHVREGRLTAGHAPRASEDRRSIAASP